MRYVDQHDNTICLTPSDGWQYATGCWVDNRGETLNLPEKIAAQGGILALDDPKEHRVIQMALTYAKQRRERSITAMQREIANLDEANCECQ